jgi:hypothetical protein
MRINAKIDKALEVYLKISPRKKSEAINEALLIASKDENFVKKFFITNNDFNEKVGEKIEKIEKSENKERAQNDNKNNDGIVINDWDSL